MFRRILPRLAAALLVVAVLAVGVLVVGGDDPSPPPRPAPTLNGPGHLEEHTNLRAVPKSVTPDELRRARELNKQTAKETPRPLQGLAPRAATGCRTKLNHNNYSQRNQPILIVVIHRTVSPNRPGWGDVYGVADFLDRPATRASANAIIDGEGNCLITVRASDKAWHAAAFNGPGYGIELIGNPGDPITSAQWDATARLAGPIMRDAGIPAQVAGISGAGVSRKGGTDHHALGAPGGGHYDIKTCPSCPRWTIDPLLQRLRGGTGDALLPVERQVADKRCYHRAELVAGRNRAENLRWARFYRDRILIPNNRQAFVGGQVQLVTAIDRAKAADRKPWGFRHRGLRRMTLLNIRKGVGC